MNASRFLSSVSLVALFTLGCASAVESLDNEKLLEMVKGGNSPKIVMLTIKASEKECRFTASIKDLTAIVKSCKEVIDPKWSAEEIDTLQAKVLELSTNGIKELKNLVNLFLAAVENDDETQNPQQYEELMHKLVRAGSPIVPFLRDNLTQESERKRKGVLDALGRIGDKTDDLLKEIVMLLDDPSKPVRAQAAKTVAILYTPTTGQSLITMLNRRDKKNDAIALALGYMRYEPAIEPLVTVLKTSRETDDRVCAAFALGEMRAKTFGAPDAIMLGILDDKEETLRDVCARGAALLGDKRTPYYITRAFERFRPGRKTIITYLSYFKSIHAARFLANQLEDSEDAEVRKAAKATLELMTGEKFGTKEDWTGFIDLLGLRPDWAEPKENSKLPDAQEPK